ncbi:LIC14007 family protein [Leptospira sanjuanensis]|uniref:LIC14007 family protein n=1 Tax=Leptospira sanjuanensis TaxID=2879643 RepID=UPI001EE95D96|nr:hypothetical protein [Leptospira sanjuanensis]MCG6167960.1 hypothetical protein [Leptospira sanjuanensis]
MKIYSGIIGSTKLDQPPMFVTKNGLKKRMPIQEPQKVLETSLAYSLEKNVLLISYNLLLDHTGDTKLAESSYLQFSARFHETFTQESWFFLSNRIETFLREYEQAKLDFHYDSKF